MSGSSAPGAAASIVVARPFQPVVDAFADYVHVDGDVFDYLVVLAGRTDSPGPRDPMWEHVLDAGMLKIPKVLAKEPIGDGPHFFIFPDRWMVPGEAQLFYYLLKQNPDAAKFGRVYVVTHQPYLVADCLKGQVRVMTNKEET